MGLEVKQRWKAHDGCIHASLNDEFEVLDVRARFKSLNPILINHFRNPHEIPASRYRETQSL